MTDDVVLRAALDSDEDALYRCLTDLDSWEERSPRLPRPVSREQFRARQAAHEPDERSVEFVIQAAGRPVGRCTLFGLDPLARHAEVGISLLPDRRGQGVGTAALRQLVAFGFERWNLHRLHLATLASNTAARRAYAKVGFVEEGILRQHAWVRGRWDDEVLMGLLRADWRAGQ